MLLFPSPAVYTIPGLAASAAVVPISHVSRHVLTLGCYRRCVSTTACQGLFVHNFCLGVAGTTLPMQAPGKPLVDGQGTAVGV